MGFGQGAGFQSAAFGGWATFWGATFGDGADFGDAHVPKVDFFYTGINRGSLRVANGQARVFVDALWPWYQPPLVLDRTRIRDTDFHSRSRDPWSVLRRSYTGSNMVFILLFTLLTFAPIGARTVFWGGLSKAQQHGAPVMLSAIGDALEVVAGEDGASVVAWRERAEGVLDEADGAREVALREIGAIQGVYADGCVIVERVRGSAVMTVEQLAALERFDRSRPAAEAVSRAVAPDGEMRLRVRRVVGVVLGVDRGWWVVVLSFVLIGYNVVRAWLTWMVGPMRDHVDQVGVSPAKEEYWRLWRVHQVISPVLGISVLYGLWRLGSALWLPVLAP